MKKLIWILIPLTLAFTLCAKAEKTESQAETGQPGEASILSAAGEDAETAPEFTLTDLNGNEITLSGLNGKVIFLNFWATWCPPCREEIPGFIEVYDKYKSKGMEILGVSVDKDGPGKVREFANEYKINYPVGIGTSQLIGDYKPGRYIPTTIVIDKNGKIRHKHVGYMDKSALEKFFLSFSGGS